MANPATAADSVARKTGHRCHRNHSGPIPSVAAQMARDRSFIRRDNPLYFSRISIILDHDLHYVASLSLFRVIVSQFPGNEDLTAPYIALIAKLRVAEACPSRFHHI
jgi:hypothetical protein